MKRKEIREKIGSNNEKKGGDKQWKKKYANGMKCC